MPSTDELLAELLRQPAEDRARAAERLLASLHESETDPEWEAAWLAEVDRRLADVEAGEQTVSWEDAKRILREQLVAR